MKLTQLSTIAEIVSGATPKTGNPAYWDGDIPWATPADLSKLSGTTFETTNRRITQEGLDSCSATLLPVGSVLLSSRAPIGYVAINSVPMATNQGFKSLVPNSNLLDAKYLYFWLRANRTYLESLGNGATFKELSRQRLAAVKIPLPETIEEQRRIAAILDQADALRAKRREQLALLDALPQAIFHEMFDIASLPKTTLRAHSLIAGEYGAAVASTDFDRRRPRYVRITDIGPHGRLNDDRRSPAGPPAAWERYQLEAGDLLFARSGATVGKTYLHPEGGQASVFAGYLIRFRLSSDALLPEFVFAYTQTDTYASWVSMHQNTVAQPNINAKQYADDLPVPLPPLARQIEYLEAVTSSQPERARLSTAANYADGLFASLQSRAFRGEL